MFKRANRFQNVLSVGLLTLASAFLWQPVAALSATAKSKVAVNKKAAPTKTASKSAAKKAPSRAVAAKAQRVAKGKVPAKRVAQSFGKTTSKTKVAGRKTKGTAVAAAKRSRAMPAVLAKTRVTQSALLRVAAEPRLSVGERLGLRGSDDPLDLSSSVALVVDQDTNEILLSKNDSAVLPIASLTKLMTGLVLAEADLPQDELITITQADVDTYKGSRSRLSVGATASRGELMHLALMSSENRAAHALGRTFPSGIQQFVRLMNAKARELGMTDTRYVEPTGLSSLNQSSARDLVTLVSAAYEHPILRNLSTSPSYQLEVGQRTLQYNNSNRLIRNPDWEIGLQKTGYISEAGRCLVMQAKVAGRKLIMVFLDSAGKLSRAQDAERVRRWVEAQTYTPVVHRPQG